MSEAVQVVLSNNFTHNRIIMLYEPDTGLYEIFRPVVKGSIEDHEICVLVCASATILSRLETVFRKEIADNRLCLMYIDKTNLLCQIEQASHRLEQFGRHMSDSPALRMIIDFSSLGASYTKEDIMSAIKRLETAQFSIRSIVAFDISALTGEMVKALAELSGSLVILMKNEHAMWMLTFRAVQLSDSWSQTHASTIKAIPRDIMERVIKRNLETVILSILLEGPMCGYELIRTIYRRYNVFLSQGTIYPMLYTLKKSRVLEIVKSESSRSKVYGLSEQGKEEAISGMREFFDGYRYLLESLRRC